MVNYQDAKIYKLVGSGLTYYGSTCNELYKRLYWHKKNLDCSSKILFKLGKVEIILVEKYPCNDKIELTARERYYIENNECVNKRIPNRTEEEKKIYIKEYKEKNKDIIKKKNNKYYEENKDIINEKSKEYKRKNPDKRKEYNRKYYEKNKDKIKQYQEENKHKIKEYNRKYYEEKKLKKDV
jgi:hypothetical protein